MTGYDTSEKTTCPTKKLDMPRETETLHRVNGEQITEQDKNISFALQYVEVCREEERNLKKIQRNDALPQICLQQNAAKSSNQKTEIWRNIQGDKETS